MRRVPYVSIILENAKGEVLLALRENRSARMCPKRWTLIMPCEFEHPDIGYGFDSLLQEYFLIHER